MKWQLNGSGHINSNQLVLHIPMFEEMAEKSKQIKDEGKGCYLVMQRPTVSASRIFTKYY
jgi:hypothetical protein